MSAEQLDLVFATRARDEALARVDQVISPQFRADAARFVVAYLSGHGPTAGEVLTAEGERIGGLRPSDLRHWGSVFQRLARAGVIEQCGWTTRLRGHRSGGGRMWRLKARGGGEDDRVVIEQHKGGG